MGYTAEQLGFKTYRMILIDGILRIKNISLKRDELEHKTLKELEHISSYFEKYQLEEEREI